MTISRRDMLLGATAALIVKGADDVKFEVPAKACDCHVHIFGDPAKYPMSPARQYTPAPALVEQLQAALLRLQVDRVVIVQPSVYGTDNSCTTDSIRQLGPRARGIAVIDENATGALLDDLHRRGIRGIRVNLGTTGVTDTAVASKRLQDALGWVAGRKWHVQVYTQLSVIQAIAPLVSAAAIPIVFDHFGGAQAELGADQPGFDVLLNLARSGRAYVKISAPYRSSKLAPDYADVAPLAKALIAANPERILWGSDWPHPDTAPSTSVSQLLTIDDGRVFNLLPTWAPDAEVRNTILVENPARLYGF